MVNASGISPYPFISSAVNSVLQIRFISCVIDDVLLGLIGIDELTSSICCRCINPSVHLRGIIVLKADTWSLTVT